MKYQATTTNRPDITLSNQFYWHTTSGAGLNKLRDIKTGECNMIGKTSGEFIWHFIVDSDKICIYESSIHLHVIGLAELKNNEKILHNSCCYITKYCTGSITGKTERTIFLMELERILSIINGKLL